MFLTGCPFISKIRINLQCATSTHISFIIRNETNDELGDGGLA